MHHWHRVRVSSNQRYVRRLISIVLISSYFCTFRWIRNIKHVQSMRYTKSPLNYAAYAREKAPKLQILLRLRKYGSADIISSKMDGISSNEAWFGDITRVEDHGYGTADAVHRIGIRVFILYLEWTYALHVLSFSRKTNLG